LRETDAYSAESFVFVGVALDGILHRVSLSLYLESSAPYGHWLRERPHKQRGDLECERHGGRDGMAVTVL